MAKYLFAAIFSAVLYLGCTAIPDDLKNSPGDPQGNGISSSSEGNVEPPPLSSSSAGNVNPPPPISSSASNVNPPPSSSSVDMLQNRNANLIWNLTEDNLGIVINGEYAGGWFVSDDGGEDGNSRALFKDAVFGLAATAQNWTGEVQYTIRPSFYEYAYSAVGFSWRKDGSVAANVWGSHTGLCVEYSLSGNGDYYIVIATNGSKGWNEYRKPLDKKSSIGKVLFSFSSFAQDDWGGEGVKSLAEAKAISTGISFKGEAHSLKYTGDQTGIINLRSIRWDSCN
ncbi:MAG: hypothetical protein FWC26_07900 [Fibromonadales bacterium]|nr:hypothetical protein [Fibromonadales bacterium]